MHNNKRLAARRIVRVDPAEPMNKQEKKKGITEQLKLINAALAECFYLQLFLVQWYPMIIFQNSYRVASHDYLKKTSRFTALLFIPVFAGWVLASWLCWNRNKAVSTGRATPAC